MKDIIKQFGWKRLLGSVTLLLLAYTTWQFAVQNDTVITASGILGVVLGVAIVLVFADVLYRVKVIIQKINNKKIVSKE